jgi:hypothetical protein
MDFTVFGKQSVVDGKKARACKPLFFGTAFRKRRGKIQIYAFLPSAAEDISEEVRLSFPGKRTFPIFSFAARSAPESITVLIRSTARTSKSGVFQREIARETSGAAAYFDDERGRIFRKFR